MKTVNRYFVTLFFLLISFHAPGSEVIPECVEGRAGPYATIALLTKKAELSDADFYAYWRDIHGMLATRIPGFWSYRQYHLDGELTTLRRVPMDDNKSIESIQGFADVSFCSEEAIMGLVASPQAELIKHDEQNVFASSYLYAVSPGDSQTLMTDAPLAELAKDESGYALVMLLAKGEDETLDAFNVSLNTTLKGLPVSCPTLQRLRMNAFQPYNAAAWPAPGVNHRPSQVMHASIEFQFPDRKTALECLSHTDQFSLSAKGVQTRLQLVYVAGRRYAMVVDGRISEIGLRGLPALELIQRVGADNQRSSAVLEAVFGKAAQ
ncbi:MAG: EthD domain-containing protein [Pseudomonadales bacterium]|nr:EthD domain-containing protein [Pseudomonadales bacterium]